MKTEVSTLLKSKRKELKLTVKEVVDGLRLYGFTVAEKTVYGWESGNRQPDADTFLALCKIYGIKSLPLTKESPDSTEVESRDKADFEIIGLLSKLDDSQKDFLIALLETIVERNQQRPPAAPASTGEITPGSRHHDQT